MDAQQTLPRTDPKSAAVRSGPVRAGGPDCTCPGEVCQPWCTCESCDARDEAVFVVKIGRTFGDLVGEMVEMLAEDRCGGLVLTTTHRDADGALKFAFEVPTEDGRTDETVTEGRGP